MPFHLERRGCPALGLPVASFLSALPHHRPAPNSHRPFSGHPLGCTTAQARKPGLAKITDVSEIPVITYLAGLRVLIPLPFPAKALYERERKKEGLKGSPPPPTGPPKDGSDVEKGCEVRTHCEQLMLAPTLRMLLQDRGGPELEYDRTLCASRTSLCGEGGFARFVCLTA